MMFIKTIANFHFPKQLITTKIFFSPQLISFITTKKSINDELHHIANKVNPKLITEDFSQIANNYIQLEEQSFVEYAKTTKNDPQMMLMFLSTFQSSQKIAENLPTLYPHIDYFQGKQLLLLMQKILAFKPTIKPKVPFPKPLKSIQSILVIMSEIFIADTLLEWLKLIPTYTGKEYYILFMGYFSILQKMSLQLKSRNRNLLIKCHEKISKILKDSSQSLEIRVGIIALSFQMNYGQAIMLLINTQIDFKIVQVYKICLLFINIEKYQIKKNKSKSNQIKQQLTQQQQIIQKLYKKYRNEMISQIIEIDFSKFMKIDLFIQMWNIISQHKQIKGIYQALSNKLVSCIHDIHFLKSLQQLTITQLLIIIQAFEKHKINNQKSLKVLLVLFSPYLHHMNKLQFIRLLKCLVTYVRQCQNYLIDCRKVLHQRKLQFNDKDVQNINLIFRRVQILFPHQFSNK